MKKLLFLLVLIFLTGASCGINSKLNSNVNSEDTSITTNKCKESCLDGTAEKKCRIGIPTGGDIVKGECQCYCYETPPPINQ